MAYERIVAAAMKGENALWELGDEIIAETGNARSRIGVPNHGLLKKLKEIAEELVNCGFNKYKEKSLSDIRNTALDFQGSNRFKGVAFSVHTKIANPEELRKVIEYAKSVGRTKPVSEDFIRVYEAAEKEHRREQLKEAHAALEQAKAKIEEAKEELRKANSPQAKATAARKLKEAEEEKKAATQLVKDLKTAPKVNHNAPSKGRANTPMLVVRTKFAADLSTAKSLVEKMNKDVDPHIDNLPDTFIDMAAEELLEIAEMFRQLSFKVRSKKSNKRSHLHAVGE